MIGKAVGSGRQDHVFERENVLGETLYTLDFYVAAHKLGIEVDG